MSEAIDRSFVASRLEADLRAAADSQAVAEIVGGVLGDPGRMGPLTEWARESPEAAEAWAIRVRAIRGAARGVDALQRRWRAPRRPTEAETVDGVPEEWAARVPYEVLPSGVGRVDDQGRRERVASRPVWPVGYLRDVDGDGYSVVLQWVGVSGEVQRCREDGVCKGIEPDRVRPPNSGVHAPKHDAETEAKLDEWVSITQRLAG